MNSDKMKTGNRTMAFVDLVKKNRSFRRFDQSVIIENSTLKQLVELARVSASAANFQPLKYVLSSDEAMNGKIFDCLAWAAYLKEWKGPEKGEQPSAYIVILGDKSITGNFRCDHGIAAQSILLGAREMGLGGCILAAINHEKIRQLLDIDPEHEVLLVIALGKPVENVVLEDVGADGSIRYWRDSDGVHHVPKRSIDEIVVANY